MQDSLLGDYDLQTRPNLGFLRYIFQRSESVVHKAIPMAILQSEWASQGLIEDHSRHCFHTFMPFVASPRRGLSYAPGSLQSQLIRDTSAVNVKPGAVLVFKPSVLPIGGVGIRRCLLVVNTGFLVNTRDAFEAVNALRALDEGWLAQHLSVPDLATDVQQEKWRVLLAPQIRVPAFDIRVTKRAIKVAKRTRQKIKIAISSVKQTLITTRALLIGLNLCMAFSIQLRAEAAPLQLSFASGGLQILLVKVLGHYLVLVLLLAAQAGSVNTWLRCGRAKDCDNPKAGGLVVSF
ncbi:MAG: hypothetical protein Q9186_004299 [Xanthomendoza sp. 1 TL-2023]